MNAKEIAAAIRNREISSVEATRSCLDRIERHNPVLNAFLSVCAESALEDAARADAALKTGESGRALLGVPIAVKDLHESAGIRTTFGLAAHADHIPEADCVMGGTPARRRCGHRGQDQHPRARDARGEQEPPRTGFGKSLRFGPNLRRLQRWFGGRGGGRSGALGDRLGFGGIHHSTRRFLRRLRHQAEPRTRAHLAELG